MKRKLSAAIFCLALMGAPAVSYAGTPDAAQEAVQSARLQAGDLVSAASKINLKAVDYRKVEGNLSSQARLPYAGPMCKSEGADTQAAFYSYTGSLPDSALQLCASSGQAVAETILPGYAVADATLNSALAEAASGKDMPDVPIVVNKNVESFIRYFQTGGRKYFEKWMGRSKDYMTMLQGILKENGLPEDLSYIAFIESGLNPTVKSRANAVGMWQFIKGTAKNYGLRVDWWIDERMDPEKATYAAAKYFKNLYGMFGSWYLAAASYNAGEGRVARAIKKHGTDDFWELASQRKPLHRETKDYVPKYLAAVTIGKDPGTYGFDSVELNDGMRYDKVKVSQATDLKVIAEASGTSVEEIRRLNPELLRWFTPPNYPGYRIKIPEGRSDEFYANMSKLPPAKRIAFLQHKVRRGETVSKIAKKYGTGVNPIMYLNNISNNRVRPGTIIMIPVRANSTAKGRYGDSVAEIVTRMELHS